MPAHPCLAGLRPLTPEELPGGPASLASALSAEPARVRWAGLAVPDPAASRAPAFEGARDWLSRADPASLVLLAAGGADRWGRVPVVAAAGGEILNGALLRQGAALFSPGDVSLPCARALREEEDAARRAGRGLWSPGGDPPLVEASRPAAILARAGRLTLVEGRVLGLGETRTRVYLNFGTVRSEDFTVSIQKRNLRKFEASGMRWTSWEGRRIRVRGVVVPAGGPLIELSAPDDVERLD